MQRLRVHCILYYHACTCTAIPHLLQHVPMPFLAPAARSRIVKLAGCQEQGRGGECASWEGVHCSASGARRRTRAPGARVAPIPIRRGPVQCWISFLLVVSLHAASHPRSRPRAEFDLLVHDDMEEGTQYAVPPLVWDVIKAHLPPAEQEEVRRSGTRALAPPPAPSAARCSRTAAGAHRPLKMQAPALPQVSRAVGRALLEANADAHQEAAALAELLGSAAAANAAALQRLALVSSPQRRMVRCGRKRCELRSHHTPVLQQVVGDCTVLEASRTVLTPPHASQPHPTARSGDPSAAAAAAATAGRRQLRSGPAAAGCAGGSAGAQCRAPAAAA